MGAIILFGGFFLLVIINMVFFRTRRIGHHDIHGRFVPPGYANFGEYDYSNRLSEQMTAVVNTVLFIAILFIAIAYFSNERRSISQVDDVQTERTLDDFWASK